MPPPGGEKAESAVKALKSSNDGRIQQKTRLFYTVKLFITINWEVKNMTALKKCLCLVLAVLTVAPFSVLAAETGTPATGTPALTQTATSPADETLPAETTSGEPIKFSDVDYDSTLGKRSKSSSTRA